MIIISVVAFFVGAITSVVLWEKFLRKIVKKFYNALGDK